MRFSHILGASLGCEIVLQVLLDKSFCTGQKAERQGTFVCLLLCLFFWALWEARNKAKFEEFQISSFSVINRVRIMIKMLNDSGICNPKSWTVHSDATTFLSCGVVQVQRRSPRPFKWTPPSSRWYKLNCALKGPARNRCCAGGVIVRDEAGNCRFAIGMPSEVDNLLIAEALVVIEAITLAMSLSLTPLIVESNSASLIKFAAEGQGRWNDGQI